MGNDSSRDKKNNAVNLIIALLSCSLAPVISHFLDLVLENNEWDTERILVLYFASVTGFILQDKAYRAVKETGLYERGFKLGNSDALGFIIWSFPVAIVVVMYDDIVGIGSLAVMIVCAIIIVSKDYNRIQISSITMTMSGGVLLLFILFSVKMLPHLAKGKLTFYYLKWMMFQFIICILIDMIVKLIGKIKAERLKRKDI
jgi:hypothetical protein